MTSLTATLEELRGPAPPRDFTARTLAALTANPGCARRAVLDAAGVDKAAVAGQAGFPPPAAESHSRFALARGTEFEAAVLSDGAAELLHLLREVLGLELAEAGYVALDSVGEDTSRTTRHRHTRTHLLRTASGEGEAATLFDHPLLRLDVAGVPVHLEPDVVAFQAGGQFHVVEIKSFPVVDGRADPAQVGAAATQAAVYILALRHMLAEAGLPPELVSDRVVLVTPRNFSLRPTASLVDARTKVGVLRRQLQRLDDVEALVAQLPAGLSLDLALDDGGRPQRPAGELRAALGQIGSRYRPSCLASCELAHLCRDEARCGGSLAVFGGTVRDELGGVPDLDSALALATGERAPEPEQRETARALRHAERLRQSLEGARQ